jgi:hypothetical protein
VSEFNEEKLTEILKAAGHDVYLADLPRWCRWRSGAVVAGYASPTTGWPMLISGPDAYADPLGRASTYDEVLALLAPLLPATATISAIPLDAEHERRVEAHIRENAPVAAGRSFTWAEFSDLKAERDDLRVQAVTLTADRDAARSEVARLTALIVRAQAEALAAERDAARAEVARLTALIVRIVEVTGE